MRMKIFIVSKAEHESGKDTYQNIAIEAYTDYDTARAHCIRLEEEIPQYVYHYYFVTEVELIK